MTEDNSGALIKLAGQIKATRSELGVRNRQPQGQLVPFTFSGADVFDSADTMDVFFSVASRIAILVEVLAFVHFREFFAPATSASSGGGSTSGSSSSSSTSSGGSSTPTSSSQGSHQHLMASRQGAAAGGASQHFKALIGTATLTDIYINQATPLGSLWTNFDGTHTHTVDVPAHTHGIAHDHTTPDHEHALAYGVFKEPMPASHDVAMGVYRRSGSSWTLLATVSGLTADDEEVNLTQWVDGPGQYRLSLTSAGGQPNGGRLGCDVYGHVLGAIQST